MKTFTCRVCGKQFQSSGSRAATCSPQCRNSRHNEYQQGWRKNKPPAPADRQWRVNKTDQKRQAEQKQIDLVVLAAYERADPYGRAQIRALNPRLFLAEPTLAVDESDILPWPMAFMDAAGRISE